MVGIQRILCPTDFSAASDGAVDLAAGLAARWGAALTVQYNLDADSSFPLSVPSPREGGPVDLHRELRRTAEERVGALVARRGPGACVEVRLTRGRPHESILNLARSL